MKTFYLTCIAILWISVLTRCGTDCCDETVDNDEPIVKTDTINSKADSLFIIADQLVDEIYIEQTTYDNVIHTQELTIEQQVSKLSRTLKELEEKNKEVEKEHELAEEHAKLAQEMKRMAEHNRLEAERAREVALIQIHELKEEKDKMEKEINELKKECIRLNGLLGNDYNVSEIDSIVELPDSIKIEPKKIKNRSKKKKNK